MGRNDLLHSGFEMPLPDFFPNIQSGLGGSGAGRLNDGILNIAAADGVSFRKPPKIDVWLRT